ncbi:prolyl oligopeptidase family serine peptidase [uncultured Chryseobacterium sp.]|uniref:alpha/beta hydrolase family protein n=1 Tax=uncultured Chryseobacterium sp. TaxID=259322 RepID=UPI0025868345|nr:prolyl oligopeptidase family serine peptidase [uncultured Chryseobacterium sp.]
MELSEFKNYLIIYEKDRLSQLRRMVVIDSKRETVYYPLGPSFIQQDFSTFKEIRNDHAALLKVVRFERTSTGYVDLYYGKDKDLKSKMDGKKAVEEYWLWNVKTNNIQKFDLGQNRSVTDIGNGTQFLHYDGNELRDYTRHRPLLNVSLYNSKTKSNYPIGIIQPQIVSSGNGRYLLYQSEDAKWEMLNTSNNKRTFIEKNDLRNPVFTENDQSIYFESSAGLWEYNLNSGLLTQLNASRGKKVRILNTDRSFLSQGISIYHSTIDSDTPLIIESLDSISQTVSYYSLKGHKILQDFLITKNKVSKFLHSDRLDRWCWLEENYNLAPMLKESAKHASAQMLYNENQNDRSAKEIRQEMIDYRLTNGKALKGLLYYPQHFNPSTQYPMIVHIYQIQHTKSKEYLIPKFDGLGFNIRLLLEQGYFVFLPDLLTDRRGPGIAGLECINAALDALADHQNIDHSKIGLTGHSFGGYLTNLISTQSNRFAAYISGSGVSDIIQSYYSLNRNFPGPHYWQLESGQYQMASSLADNKQLYFNNNPIYDAEKLSAPILLWTGKTDENVVPENTMGFYLALKRYRKDVIALFYHKSGHSLTDEPERLDLNKKALEWWAYFLKDQKEVPWINQQMKKDAH